MVEIDTIFQTKTAFKKTIPFGAAHTYIDYIRDYPPQGAYASETNQWYGSTIELNVNVTKIALLIKLTHQEKK